MSILSKPVVTGLRKAPLLWTGANPVRCYVSKIVHPVVIGPRGQTIKQLSQRTGVQINSLPTIVMKREEKVEEKILIILEPKALVPVTSDFHGQIIIQKGAVIRQLMDTHEDDKGAKKMIDLKAAFNKLTHKVGFALEEMKQHLVGLLVKPGELLWLSCGPGSTLTASGLDKLQRKNRVVDFNYRFLSPGGYRPLLHLYPALPLQNVRHYRSSSRGLTGKRKLIIIVADQVKLRNSLRYHNSKAKGKAGMPFPQDDFRLRLLFGYRNSPNYDDKFDDLVSAQNELCHCSFHIESDHSRMKTLSVIYREYMWITFRLTPGDIEELSMQVKALIAEFVRRYNV